MDVHLKVALEDGGPVVVKTASGPAARRLRQERARLARAVHPGVVALARSHADDSANAGDDDEGNADDEVVELRTSYAGEPVVRWSGSVAAVAGLGAAVASTLADLHEMGVVHGRIDGSHVLVADDGRPRLCGLAGLEGAAAGDDVAALGALLGELLARCPDRPRGRLTRRRGAGAARRALQQVLDQATDPVPTRRPGARALADAILSSVPGAHLPEAGRPAAFARVPGAGALPTEPGTRGVDGQAPDTLDRIWSYADPRSDEERWAEALGSGPPDLPAAGGDGSTLPLAVRDTPPWGEETVLHDLGVAVDGTEAPSRGSGTRPWAAAVDATGTDPWAAAVDGTGPPVDRTEPVPLDPDLTRDHVATAGRVAALRRQATDRDRSRAPERRRARLAVAGAAAVGVATVGVAMASATVLGPGGGADAPRSGPAPRPPAVPGECAAVPAPAADVDGDGCPEALSVRDRTVDAGVARWSLGEPGDHVALGDWDCDGQASAAVVRPGTGEVFVFGGWVEAGEAVTVDASERVDGAVGIRARPDGAGCDDLVVDLDAGGSATLDLDAGGATAAVEGAA
ncbi:MAG TPA: hypothetical protein VFZ79_14120 [Acidimicrobiales bacterium]